MREDKDAGSTEAPSGSETGDLSISEHPNASIVRNRRVWDRFWAGVGKIALVVGLVWGLVQIGQSSIADYDLHASGHYALFEVPNATIQELDALDANDLEKHARKLLSSPEPTTTQSDLSVKRDDLSKHKAIVDGVGGWLENHYPIVLRRLIERSEGVVWIDVRNEGRKEAIGLELQLPGSGWYVLSRPGGTEQFAEFDSVVPLGSIKPGARLGVTA